MSYKSKFLKIFQLKLILYSFSLLCVLPSFAQQVDPAAIDRATREINQPKLDTLNDVIFPEQRVKPTLPNINVHQGPVFFIEEIVIDGIEHVPEEELWPIMEPYENREVYFGELLLLAKKLELAYLERGIIAACIVPPQDLIESIVAIEAVEAKMGRLRYEEHPHFYAERLSDMWIPESHKVLRYNELMKSLFLLNKNPDREVKSTLMKGEEPETTDIQLNVKTSNPFHITGSLDNEGAPATGTLRKGLGWRYNNLLGFDDHVIAGYSWGDHFDNMYFYHTVPVSKHGTSLVYGYSYSKSFPKKDVEELLLDARSRTISFGVHQDIFSDGKYRGTANVTLDVKNKSTSSILGTINKDSLRVLRMGGYFYLDGFGGVTTVEPKLSYGLDCCSATTDLGITSRGAKPGFTKFNLGIQHQRLIPGNLLAIMKLKGQISSNKLAPQEQFYLGGINSVRGYPSGDFSGDDAFLSNLELQYKLPLKYENLHIPFEEETLLKDMRIVGFYDHGWGNKSNHAGTEQDTANMVGVGGGLHLRFAKSSLLRMIWGFPIGDEATSMATDSQFHFALDFLY